MVREPYHHLSMQPFDSSRRTQRLLRILQIVPSFGPLILMLGKMIRDVIRVVVLNVVVLFAFTFGTFTLLNSLAAGGQYLGSNWSNLLQGACEDVDRLQGSFTDASRVFWVLFNGKPARVTPIPPDLAAEPIHLFFLLTVPFVTPRPFSH